MSDNRAATKLHQEYNSGKRQFIKAQLEKADLEELFLSRSDLKESNLNHANLKDADLSDANLSKSSLIGANLSRAHLSRANLAETNLSRANFSAAILTRAKFTGASLDKVCLISAILLEADFSCADLSGANLTQVDLSTVNLTGAFYDDDTIFPADFDPVKSGMVKECNFEDLIARLNYLCECSNKYLGNMMTTRYIKSSRPNSDWLEQFVINKSNQIDFQGSISDSITPQQLNLVQQWIDSFIKSCSSIIKDFSKMI